LEKPSDDIEICAAETCAARPPNQFDSCHRRKYCQSHIVSPEELSYACPNVYASVLEYMRMNHIANQCRDQTLVNSRLPMTEPREVIRDGRRLKFEGHIDVDMRMCTGYFTRVPTYTRVQGDDMKLFVTILLDFIPKRRIGKVWKDSKGVFELPNNTEPGKFHRKYTEEMWRRMGHCPELWRWRRAFIQFLHDKIPPWPKKNDFKWIGFWMTDAEIDEVVTKTTLHYGMQRMGYSPWYTVPCWS
jgi:hypothetical protein